MIEHMYIRVVKTEAGLWSVSNSLDLRSWLSPTDYVLQSDAIDHAFARAVNWERITGGTSGVTVDTREKTQL